MAHRDRMIYDVQQKYSTELFRWVLYNRQIHKCSMCAGTRVLWHAPWKPFQKSVCGCRCVADCEFINGLYLSSMQSGQFIPDPCRFWRSHARDLHSPLCHAMRNFVWTVMHACVLMCTSYYVCERDPENCLSFCKSIFRGWVKGRKVRYINAIEGRHEQWHCGVGGYALISCIKHIVLLWCRIVGLRLKIESKFVKYTC